MRSIDVKKLLEGAALVVLLSYPLSLPVAATDDRDGPDSHAQVKQDSSSWLEKEKDLRDLARVENKQIDKFPETKSTLRAFFPVMDALVAEIIKNEQVIARIPNQNVHNVLNVRLYLIDAVCRVGEALADRYYDPDSDWAYRGVSCRYAKEYTKNARGAIQRASIQAYKTVGGESAIADAEAKRVAALNIADDTYEAACNAMARVPYGHALDGAPARKARADAYAAILKTWNADMSRISAAAASGAGVDLEVALETRPKVQDRFLEFVKAELGETLSKDINGVYTEETRDIESRLLRDKMSREHSRELLLRPFFG